MELETLLDKLRMEHLEAQMDAVCEQAAQKQLDYKAFLVQALSTEWQGRYQRGIEARLKLARFPWIKTLEQFDFEFQPSLDRRQVRELTGMSFVERAHNVILLGPPGVGKTHLAIALGKRLCQEGHPTVFLPVNFLFEEIQAAKTAGRYLNYVRSLIKAKVLILDDLALRNYTHEEATSLMDILEERYHKAPLIVTSQVEPQGWLKLFEDPVIGEAIVDRLIHPAQKIALKGDKSYREKIGEKKTGLKN